jgi:hypothetical protein
MNWTKKKWIWCLSATHFGTELCISRLGYQWSHSKVILKEGMHNKVRKNDIDIENLAHGV